MEVAGETFAGDDLMLKRGFKGDKEVFEAAVSEDGKVMVVLDTRKDEKVLSQKLAREIVSRIQKLRKKSGLQVGETVEVRGVSCVCVSWVRSWYFSTPKLLPAGFRCDVFLCVGLSFSLRLHSLRCWRRHLRLSLIHHSLFSGLFLLFPSECAELALAKPTHRLLKHFTPSFRLNE